MRFGVVLEAFLDRTLDDALDLLAATAPAVTDLEVGVGGFAPSPHCDVERLLHDQRARTAWLDGIEARGFRVSALNVSGNPLDPDHELRRRHDTDLRNAVRLASLLGVDRIVAMAGCPGGLPGDRTVHFDAGGWLPYLAGIHARQWDDAVLPYWTELAAETQREHPTLLICVELHPGTCVYNSETLERLKKQDADAGRPHRRRYGGSAPAIAPVAPAARRASRGNRRRRRQAPPRGRRSHPAR